MQLSIINRNEIEFQRLESEFYQPKFLRAKQIAGSSTLGDFGVRVIHPAEVMRVYSENGSLRIVLAQNVRDNVMDWSTIKKMDESMRPAIRRNKLVQGDVLVTRSGANYGQTSVITIEASDTELFACADVLILKPGIVGGPLLSTYLNCSIGKLLMNRGVYGAGQPHVAPTYIGKIQFPKYLLQFKEQTEAIVIRSRMLQRQSQNLYEQAAQLLDDVLGLNRIQFKREKNYTTTFSDLVSSQRLDSNHFKPEFAQLIRHIKNNFSCINLGQSMIVNRRGVQPLYIPNGIKKVVTSQHITGTHLDYDSFERTSEKHFYASTQAHVRYGDILTYTTGAYVGQTNVYLDSEPALASNHVNILRLRNSKIDPVYVAFVMNSLVGKFQTEKHIRGSAQAELYPHDIAKYIIPILADDIMAKISENVKESLTALRKSKELLEQAKQEVETLIEQAAQSS